METLAVTAAALHQAFGWPEARRPHPGPVRVTLQMVSLPGRK